LTRYPPARSIPNLCRHSKIRMRRRRRPRNCSRANRRRFLGRRARSAAISTAASLARYRCRALDLLGKSCGCRVTATRGNPQLVRFIERFAENAKKAGWSGLLVGDMSQPRGGPMLSDHTSHQIGLDADIWFTPMPDHVQSREEREFGSATEVVMPDQLDVDPKVWTHRHAELIRTAAQDPAVIRVLVNAAIKKALCRESGTDRAWLFKVRPWYGHAEHFHVQIACPAGSAECKPARPPYPSDGCGHALNFWFISTLHPPPPKPKPALTLACPPHADISSERRDRRRGRRYR
jgi:murein endopeptidase